MKTIVLSDGRALGFAEYGDPAGQPVFFFHAAGSSGLHHPAESILRDLGIRFITTDRPGHGLSSRRSRPWAAMPNTGRRARSSSHGREVHDKTKTAYDGQNVVDAGACPGPWPKPNEAIEVFELSLEVEFME
ncbi:MAG: hypothetical protein PVH17_10025 [Anaerolineae bacterium]|jgi:pimeloyl-ACP methyl ester carboxylesterase